MTHAWDLENDSLLRQNDELRSRLAKAEADAKSYADLYMDRCKKWADLKAKLAIATNALREIAVEDCPIHGKPVTTGVAELVKDIREIIKCKGAIRGDIEDRLDAFEAADNIRSGVDQAPDDRHGEILPAVARESGAPCGVKVAGPTPSQGMDLPPGQDLEALKERLRRWGLRWPYPAPRQSGEDIKDALAAIEELERDLDLQLAFRGMVEKEIDDLRSRLATATKALRAVVDDVLEYERDNNLCPNPGREYCRDSVARARAALKEIEDA